MRLYFFTFFALMLTLCSCLEKKYIFRNQKVYTIVSRNPSYGQSGTPEITLNAYTISKCEPASLTDNGDNIAFKFTNDKTPEEVKPICKTNNSLSGYQSNFSIDPNQKTKDFYFPPNIKGCNDSSIGKKKFWYFDTKPVFQALTIPLKIRPKLTKPELKDSFPGQAESGFNIGVAFGWKLNFNQFEKTKDIFGQNTHHYSITPGLFLGTGIASLKKQILNLSSHMKGMPQ